MLPSQLDFTTFQTYDLSQAKEKLNGDISSAFATFGGGDFNKKHAELLATLKKELIKDPEALTESWLRLKKELKKEIKQIKNLGHNAIPVVNFSELETLSSEKRSQVLKTGVFLVKNVIPAEEAKTLKTDILDYIKKNPNTGGFPKDSPVVFELYWSKSQLKARSNPNLRKATRFANKLWTASPSTEICLDQNISYADRLSIRDAGDTQFSLGPHADGGSLERWEDVEYRKCYAPIFEGNWEDYNPYDATNRVSANMSLYESAGNCTAFRTFQAYLGVSEIEPNVGGMKFSPSVQLITAYYMLKPFFDHNDQIKWDAEFPGAFPGKQIEFNNETHPELELDNLMVATPKVEPGDMVFWHCDLIHLVDPEHTGDHDSSVFYIPAVPLCNLNAKYAFAQRESFLKGLAGPDFPRFPKGIAETRHIGRGLPTDIEAYGGSDCLKDFVLAKFEEEPSYTTGAKKVISEANKLLFK